MSPEKQRIAIAEVCGWTFEDFNKDHKQFAHIVLVYKNGERMGGYYPKPKRAKLTDELTVAGVPNYLSDLNAMHEAENAVADWWAYSDHLEEITGNGSGIAPIHNRLLIHATAEQRAEAFLRTLGKWEE